MMVSQLLDSEILFQDKVHGFDSSQHPPTFSPIVGTRPKFPNWIDRFLGEEFSKLKYADEVVAIVVKKDAQLRTLASVSFENLYSLHLEPALSENAIANSQNAILELAPKGINFGFAMKPIVRDIHWLDNADFIEELSLNEVINAPNSIANMSLPNLRYLGMSNRNCSEDIDWQKFFQNTSVLNLEGLYLVGFSSLTNREAVQLGQLKELRMLYLRSSATRYDFLSNLEHLEVLSLECPAVSDDDLMQLRVPEGLLSVTIFLPPMIGESTLEKFKQQNPTFKVQTYEQEIDRFVRAKTIERESPISNGNGQRRK
jgi:hypothetical protein